MKELEQRILKDGDILSGDILKVDSFLNHQLDITLLKHIGEAFYEKFKDDKVTKIVTIEASGIAIACFAALKFNVPVVFAKKAQSHNLGNEVYTSKVHSYTYDRDYDITISRKYLSEDDTIVIIDDFMANGLATEGLLDIAKQAGAKVVIKNNVAECVLLSPSEYMHLLDLVDDIKLLELAIERMNNFDTNNTIKAEEIYKKYRITEKGIENSDEVEIE